MEPKFLDFERPLEALENEIAQLTNKKKHHFVDTQPEIAQLRQKVAEQTKEIFANLTALQKVQLARHPNRPHALDYITPLITDFVELHGDRIVADDSAIIAGLGKFQGVSVAVIAQQKGRDVKENLERKFGMAHPEGYRKALRVMKLAEKFGFPVICLVDTPGANPDLEAEERGQAFFIANNLLEMALLETPVLVLIIGEGGSGGALGIAVGDRVLMQEYSIYSVISPEGCASILWKNQNAVGEAAKALKLTADELFQLGVIDGVVPEPPGGAHRGWEAAVGLVSEALGKHLRELQGIPVEELVSLRYRKYRKMGVFIDKESHE